MQCREVSVSSLRSACIWYAPRQPSVCEAVGGGAPPTLRTAWARPSWLPPTNLSLTGETRAALQQLLQVQCDTDLACDGATSLVHRLVSLLLHVVPFQALYEQDVREKMPATILLLSVLAPAVSAFHAPQNRAH